MLVCWLFSLSPFILRVLPRPGVLSSGAAGQSTPFSRRECVIRITPTNTASNPRVLFVAYTDAQAL